MNNLIKLIFLLCLIPSLIYCKKVNNLVWNTYIDSTYNFSFMYLQDWTEIDSKRLITETETAKNKKHFLYIHKFNIYRITIGDKVIPRLMLTLYLNSDSLSIKDFAYNVISNKDDKYYSKEQIIFDEMQINNLQFIKATYENKVGGYTGDHKRFFTQKYNVIFDFFLLNYNAKEYDKIINPIIKSFKFNVEEW